MQLRIIVASKWKHHNMLHCTTLHLLLMLSIVLLQSKARKYLFSLFCFGHTQLRLCVIVLRVKKAFEMDTAPHCTINNIANCKVIKPYFTLIIIINILLSFYHHQYHHHILIFWLCIASCTLNHMSFFNFLLLNLRSQYEMIHHTHNCNQS